LGRKLIIAGHLNPDGDSVGSSLALALALRNMGREVSISLNGIVSGSLDSLTRPKRLFKEVGYKELQDYDRLILVDCQSPYRVWPDSASPGDAPPIPLVAVDHHQTGQDPALYEAAFIDPAASATAELIFKVLKRLETDFTPAIIEALLAGLISDTGSFSQGNTTAECLRQASELVSMGGDIERVNQAIKQNYRLSRMRLMTKSLASLRVHHGGRMATMMVTDEMLDEAKSDLSETEGLVEYTLLLAGVRLGALIKVTGRGRTRVSLRSRPGIDVRDLARRLGGGGHQQAAAYLDDSPDPEAALRRLLSEAANLFDGISS
jgi:phosphoesterase RecJ-like protein